MKNHLQHRLDILKQLLKTQSELNQALSIETRPKRFSQLIDVSNHVTKAVKILTLDPL